MAQCRKEKEPGRFRKRAMRLLELGKRSARRALMPKNKRELLDIFLIKPAIDGNVPEIMRLVRAGANIAVKDSNGRTPLHFAAINGHTQACALLISEYTKAGGNVKELIASKDNDRWTTLRYAAAYNKQVTSVRKGRPIVTAVNSATCILLMGKYAEAGGDIRELISMNKDCMPASVGTDYVNSKTAQLLKSIESFAGILNRETFGLFASSFGECIA